MSYKTIYKDRAVLSEKEVNFLNEVNTQTDNTQNFLMLLATATEGEKHIILNLLTCIVAFGDEFMSETKPFIKTEDRNGLLMVADKYITKLKGIKQ